jgi:hypothetical protein
MRTISDAIEQIISYGPKLTFGVGCLFIGLSALAQKEANH